jgi:hypothetical protein
MASPKDYEGKQFGSFLIRANFAHGAEAEVYQVTHLGTSRTHVLRLDVNDDATWDGAPLVPPKNGSIEKPNARGTFLVTPRYYASAGIDADEPREAKMARMFKEQPKHKPTNDWTLATVAIYGVMDQRYLVPVASPIRVAGAKNVDEILSLSPADDVYLFQLWEDVAFHLLSEAHSHAEAGEGSAEWDQRWAKLSGGEVLTAAIRQYMAGGSLSRAEQDAVLSLVSRKPDPKPELAENVLLRICGAVSRSRMALPEFAATLRDRHFRVNVTVHEIEQMIAVFGALKNIYPEPENSVTWVTATLTEMENQPLNEYDRPDLFEIRSEPPDLDKFETFLQEAGGSQPFPTTAPN